MSDKAFWTKKFACGNKSCNGQLIPLQLFDNKKEGNVKAVGKCPTCTKTYEFSLPSDKESVTKWAPYVFDRMFTCTTCGQASLKQVNFTINQKMDYKIDVRCTRCNQEGERAVGGPYFHLIGNRVLEITSRDVTYFCSDCGAKIPSGAVRCTKCGAAIKK
jgi:DNA-directed RNA polymerase subunit RPC12/RpoP